MKRTKQDKIDDSVYDKIEVSKDEFNAVANKMRAAFAISTLVAFKNLNNIVLKSVYLAKKKVFDMKMDNEIKKIVKEFKIK